MEQTLKKRDIVYYEPTEKRLNVLSHALGAIGMLIGWAVLLHRSDSVLQVAACTIYCVCLFLMFFNSAMYHRASGERSSYILRAVDHCSIFFAIVGTYVPLLLLGMKGWQRVVWLALISLMGIGGIVLTIWSFVTNSVKKTQHISVALYLIMGWASLFLLPWIIRTYGWAVFAWLLAGGVLYTVGVLFYRWKSLRFNHAIWHLFIMAASAAHYAAVYLAMG